MALSSSHPTEASTENNCTTSTIDPLSPRQSHSDENTMSTPSESLRQPASELLGSDFNTIKNVAIVGVSTD